TQRRGMVDDCHHPLVPHLETVAERTMHNLDAPVLGQPCDVREYIHQPGRGEHPACDDRVPPGEFDMEPAFRVTGHPFGVAGDQFTAVTTYLFTARGDERGGRAAVTTEVTVGVFSRGITRFARIDDDDRATLPGQLHRCGQPCSRPAEYSDLAVSFD